MRIYTETPFRMTPPRMAVVIPFEPSSLWVAPKPGPIAREALEAIGLPSEVDEIRIEVKGDGVTLNGTVVSSGDATLVYCAWHCGPSPFLEEPSEDLVSRVRHAIAARLHVTMQLQGLRE